MLLVMVFITVIENKLRYVCGLTYVRVCACVYTYNTCNVHFFNEVNTPNPNIRYDNFTFKILASIIEEMPQIK